MSPIQFWGANLPLLVLVPVGADPPVSVATKGCDRLDANTPRITPRASVHRCALKRAGLALE
eukprot:1049597-Prorocentrum_minimum.AAC.3